MSYNPQTGLVYIPTNNVCMDWSVSDVTYKRGVFYLGAEFPTKEGPGGFLGELVAWDPVKNKKVWSIKEDLPFNGGTRTTAAVGVGAHPSLEHELHSRDQCGDDEVHHSRRREHRKRGSEFRTHASPLRALTGKQHRSLSPVTGCCRAGDHRRTRSKPR